MVKIRIKPLSLELLIRSMRLNARDLSKPYEERDDGADDDAAAWALEEGARRLRAQDNRIKTLERRIIKLKLKR